MHPSKVMIGSLLIVAATSLQLAGQAPVTPASATLFEGARLIVADGSAPIENSAFIVVGNKFTQVGKKGQLQLPTGGVRVDLTGKTVIPALIDAHSHPGYTKGVTDLQENYTRENFIDILQRYAYTGVAGVQALGSDSGDLPYQLRDGPPQTDAAIYTTAGSGMAAPMQGPGPAVMKPAAYGVTTVEEARKDVQELAAKKVRLVKIWVDDRNHTVTKLSPELYTAIIDEAHRHNMLVIAHASQLPDLKALLRAGLDASAHGGFISEADDELMALLKARPKFFITSNVGGNMRGLEPGRPSWFNDRLFLEVVPAGQVKRLGDQMAARMPDAVARGAARWEQLKVIFTKLRDANVRIAVGTDAGPGDQFFGWGVQVELEALVGLGFTPMQAIIAGTRTGAEVTGFDQLGMVKVGKSADFVVLDANPLDNITNTRKINKVYLRGKEVNRTALKANWTREQTQ